MTLIHEAPAEEKIELHLIPYQITPEITQIGMNGVVEPDIAWALSKEQSKPSEIRRVPTE